MGRDGSENGEGGVLIVLIMPENQELKPCPFCGTEVLIIAEEDGIIFISCACGAKGPFAGISTYGDIETAEKRAIEFWNKRAG